MLELFILVKDWVPVLVLVSNIKFGFGLENI
jgi:hypothetical protein